jgi:hypothetical protein
MYDAAPKPLKPGNRLDALLRDRIDVQATFKARNYNVVCRTLHATNHR